MNNLQRVGAVVTGILMLITGAILFWFPEEGTYIVAIILAAALFLMGAQLLIYYFTMARRMVGGKSVLLLGIFLLDFCAFTVTILDEPGVMIMSPRGQDPQGRLEAQGPHRRCQNMYRGRLYHPLEQYARPHHDLQYRSLLRRHREDYFCLPKDRSRVYSVARAYLITQALPRRSCHAGFTVQVLPCRPYYAGFTIDFGESPRF